MQLAYRYRAIGTSEGRSLILNQTSSQSQYWPRGVIMLPITMAVSSVFREKEVRLFRGGISAIRALHLMRDAHLIRAMDFSGQPCAHTLLLQPCVGLLEAMQSQFEGVLHVQESIGNRNLDISGLSNS